MHLAEFNIGTLRYDWDDPRVADFQSNLDRVNGIAQRSPGFVWQMSGDQMGDAQLDPAGPLGGNPRTASTLSVWKDAKSFEAFVWNTVHKQFYDRKAEWFGQRDGARLVMWWVVEGHRPTIAEAKSRLDHLDIHGDSDDAFGWAHLSGAHLWKTKVCEGASA
ncbi:MAG: DUF3291 domain-containing protein [Boseongicola sp.]|nr:MAG: DUF3291 domain-containing protein [Boseongicola sp.]